MRGHKLVGRTPTYEKMGYKCEVSTIMYMKQTLLGNKSNCKIYFNNMVVLLLNALRISAYEYYGYGCKLVFHRKIVL